MDYGREDARGWTVRKPGGGGPVGPGEWLFAHGVLLLAGAALGAAVGWWWPLIVHANTRGSSWSRRERLAHERAEEALVDGTAQDARRRAAIGGVCGALAATGVALASARRPIGGA